MQDVTDRAQGDSLSLTAPSSQYQQTRTRSDLNGLCPWSRAVSLNQHLWQGKPGIESRKSSWSSVGDLKGQTLLRMNFTRCAKRSVLSVSEMLVAAGLTLAIIIVLEFPPRESC